MRGAGGDAGDEVEGAAEGDSDRQLIFVLAYPDVLMGIAVADRGAGGVILRLECFWHSAYFPHTLMGCRILFKLKTDYHSTFGHLKQGGQDAANFIYAKRTKSGKRICRATFRW